MVFVCVVLKTEGNDRKKKTKIKKKAVNHSFNYVPLFSINISL